MFAELGAAAPSLTRLNRETIPFSNAGVGAITSLGKSAERSGPALVAADPVIRQIRGLANDGGAGDQEPRQAARAACARPTDSSTS